MGYQEVYANTHILPPMLVRAPLPLSLYRGTYTLRSTHVLYYFSTEYVCPNDSGHT